MKENIFSDKPANVAFAAKTAQQPAGKKHDWINPGAVAACICFAALGLFFFWKSDITHQSTPPLENIDVSEFGFGEGGWEGYLYYDASELENDNPWNENMEIITLPVYRNKAYDSSGAGVPKGLDEKEMRSLLDSAVSSLGVEVISTEVFTEEEKDGNPIPTEIRAKTNRGEINVFADGEISYFLPDGGLALPDEYSFTRGSTTADEAHKAISYLSDIYSDLLDYETPTAVSWGDYNIYGEYHRRYIVYDSSGNNIEDIINYNLRSASFYPDDNGKLDIVRTHDYLKAAEKIGDYPIVSVNEAKRRLLAGNYFTSVPRAMPGERNIAKAELVYRSGYFAKMLMPYYRFYVLLPNLEVNGAAASNGLKHYGAYYVPAIADEYITDMPVYDGHFN